MEVFRPLYEELANQFRDAWLDDELWRVLGLPDSRVFARIDVARGQRWSQFQGSWSQVRIDLRAVDGSRYGSRFLTVFTDLKNAEDAAQRIRDALSNGMAEP